MITSYKAASVLVACCILALQVRVSLNQRQRWPNQYGGSHPGYGYGYNGGYDGGYEMYGNGYGDVYGAGDRVTAIRYQQCMRSCQEVRSRNCFNLCRSFAPYNQRQIYY